MSTPPLEHETCGAVELDHSRLAEETFPTNTHQGSDQAREDRSSPASPGHSSRVASPVHTVLVLAVLATWTFVGKVLADGLRTAAHPDRVRFYAITLLFEWLLFFFVLAGVWRSGVPIRSILGNRWRSVRQVLIDSGIALGFWVLAAPVLWVVGLILRIGAQGPHLEFMLPHRPVESVWWLALSVTAGICEETVFRGYLQRQFLAFTKNTITAIVLSALIFGVAHAYQGVRMVVLISVFGAMFGLLAYWRGTVRPGMIAHTLQDSLTVLLATARR